MAIRLEKVFDSTADTWLRMQMQRDLWEARQPGDNIKVNKRFCDSGALLKAAGQTERCERAVCKPWP